MMRGMMHQSCVSQFLLPFWSMEKLKRFQFKPREILSFAGRCRNPVDERRIWFRDKVSWPASGPTKELEPQWHATEGRQSSLVKSPPMLQRADTFECRRAKPYGTRMKSDNPFHGTDDYKTGPKRIIRKKRRRDTGRPLIDSRRLTIMAFSSLAAKISDFCCCLAGRLKRFELVVSFATVQLSISIEPPPPPPKNKRFEK